MIKKLMHAFMERVSSKIFIDFHDYRETIFLAGTGRSGTTWLGDIINYKGDYRVMFEPFCPDKINFLSHFRYKQYLRPDNCDQKFMKPIKAILAGNVRHPWIDQFNCKILVKKRLIKDIRANLLLKWIKQNFEEIPIILLLRHPCAVAHSRLKLDWNPFFEEFFAQKELMEDFLNPFRSVIENATDAFEKHILLWCIETYVPLQQFKKGEIHLVFYENLCVTPEQEIKKLFRFIDEAYGSEVMSILGKPSTQSRTESAIFFGENLTESWRKHITDKQIQRSVELLSLFGLQKLYAEGSMPLINSNDILPVD